MNIFIKAWKIESNFSQKSSQKLFLNLEKILEKEISVKLKLDLEFSFFLQVEKSQGKDLNNSDSTKKAVQNYPENA